MTSDPCWATPSISCPFPPPPSFLSVWFVVPTILFQQRNMLRHSASRFHFLFFCLLPLLPLLLTWSLLLDPMAGLSPLLGLGRGSSPKQGLLEGRRQAFTFPFHLGFTPQTWVWWWFLSKARVLKNPCRWRQQYVPLMESRKASSRLWVSTYLWETLKQSSKGEYKLVFWAWNKPSNCWLPLLIL